MEFTGVHHVSLNVTDAAESTRFYTEVLGLELLERPDFGFDGAWLAAGGQQIHLMEMSGFEAPPGQHFALQVTDIDGCIRELADHGVTATSPREIEGVCRQSFFEDPTGNLIELNEPLDS